MTQGPPSRGEQFSASTSDSDTSRVTGQASATSGTSQRQSGIGEQASKVTGAAVSQAKQSAGDIAEQARQQASQLTDQAREQVSSRLAAQKDRTASGIGSIAQALRQTSEQLRDQDQSGATQYVERAADELERLSSFIENRDVSQIVDDVERFARRQPGLFLGSAFALGFVAARFLHSSSPQRGRYDLAPRYQYGGEGSSGQRAGAASYGESYTRPETTAASSTSQASTYPSSTSSPASTRGAAGTSETARTGLVGPNTSDSQTARSVGQSGAATSYDTSGSRTADTGTSPTSTGPVQERRNRENQ